MESGHLTYESPFGLKNLQWHIDQSLGAVEGRDSFEVQRQLEVKAVEAGNMRDKHDTMTLEHLGHAPTAPPKHLAGPYVALERGSDDRNPVDASSSCQAHESCHAARAS